MKGVALLPILALYCWYMGSFSIAWTIRPSSSKSSSTWVLINDRTLFSFSSLGSKSGCRLKYQSLAVSSAVINADRQHLAVKISPKVVKSMSTKMKNKPDRCLPGIKAKCKCLKDLGPQTY